jgi:hypothetical protein
MHISKIDELIDKILDDFYSNIITKNVLINKLLSENNFIKYQLNINDIFKQYFTQINLTELKDEVTNTDVLNTIIELFKKYCMIYLFLTIGYIFKDSDSVYINNVIEFSKNQSAFSFKINSFFNSESNAEIIKYYNVMKQMNILFNADVKQKEILMKKSDYVQTIKLIELIGEDVIKEVLSIKDEGIRRHSILKIIIILDIYRSHDKKNIYKLIELTENTNEEFMFIDIVVPTKEIIDFSVIESLLTKNEINAGYAYVIWDYLNETVSQLMYEGDGDEDKILKLFENKIFIPISDDLLLFNKYSERYEKYESQAEKRKEDTKIKHIINKIDNATNINSSQDAKKDLYAPLYNRKAVIVNQIENIKIINKILNQGNITSENLELLRDLESYVIYPYVNVKEGDNSIMLHFRKNNNIVRAVSFEKKGDFKQRKRDRIQMRTIVKDGLLNVVGLFVPSNIKALNCIKALKTEDVRDYKDTPNGYDAIKSLMKHAIVNGERENKSLYWFFNTDVDNIVLDTYVHADKVSKSEQIKNILVKLYDDINEQIFNRIIDNINMLNKDTLITLDLVDKVIYFYESELLKITENKHIQDKLENKLYYDLLHKSEIKYDKNDDLVYGIVGDVISLPEYNEVKLKQINKVKINVNKYSLDDKIIEEEQVEGVCQHNISWDHLNELKRYNKKLFLDELNKFVNNYVIVNIDNEYVCKSCGFYLNIKKYITDGKFDDSTQKFVVFATPLDEALEDLAGYEKFKGTIRNIDRYIEKIALITNIPYFIGFNYTIRSRRKLLVKDCIDIIIQNNIKLKKHIKQYNELSTQTYGIRKELSNLFVFELENGIFIFSSKDKDFYKPIKQNNVLAYLIFLIMLELNETQIGFIGSDKKGFCNFAVFDKVYVNIFQGLKLKKNNKGDTINVVDYPIFCYILYMIACYSTKYKLWYYDFKDKDKEDKSLKQKLAPLIQKTIIVTVIDIINSILENGMNSKEYIYEVITTKFYNKLETTFSNKKLYDSFKDELKSSLGSDKKTFIITKPEAYKLSGSYLTNYDIPINWRKITPTRLFLPTLIHKIDKYYSINNVTNCESGKFHIWMFSKGTYKCELCNKLSNETKLDNSLTDKIKIKYDLIRLENLAKVYCKIDGEPHSFNRNDKNDNVCSKCKLTDNHKYSDAELNELDKQFNIKLNKKAEESILTSTKMTNEIIKEIDYTIKLKNKIEEDFKNNIKSNNLDTFIMDFIGLFDVLGDINKLKFNTYIFDHDYLGNRLDKEIVMIDSDNKINYKTNHSFFKTDVLYYTSYKNGKIEVYYDAKTNILLGYKEENKSFVQSKSLNKKIKIEYSLLNKIKLLGYERHNYVIKINDDDKDDKNLKSNLLKNIIRNRNYGIKSFIYKFQRFINRLNNKFVNPKKEKLNQDKFKQYVNEEENYYINKFESLVETYTKKIQKINLSNDSNEHTIFKHWKGIYDITTSDIEKQTLNIENNIIRTDELNIIDKSGNILLFYIINEFKKLLNYNIKSKNIICNMLIDFINSYYSIYFEEHHENNIDYKRFNYIINSQTYVNEIMDKIGDTEGIYEEYRDPDKVLSQEEQEALDDAKEVDEALDVEGDEVDYASFYDHNLDLEPTERYIESIQNYSFQDYMYSTNS